MRNLNVVSEADLRTVCKERIEALEHWLRRLIDDLLRPAYGDYFEHKEPNGDRILKRRLAEQVEERRAREPGRYPRKVDAILLEDVVDIICNEKLYKSFFREPLSGAYPDGREEARTFLSRLLVPRNHLAHSNPISVRQAEQVVCYTNDVIDSLKSHYAKVGMNSEYNVPLFLRYSDSFGNSFTRSEFNDLGGGGLLALYRDPRFSLRPGDVLRVEVEVDSSFESDSYSVSWETQPARMTEANSTTILVLPIEVRHVSAQFYVACKVTSNKDWHRLGQQDDKVTVAYKVLPPL